MFRDDQQAMALQNDELRRELERLRGENDALRNAITYSTPSGVPFSARGLYRTDPLPLNEAERVVLGVHGLERFPVWLAALLHVVTFGLFSVIYYAVQGGRLPAIESNDPGAHKGVGFFLIPYFNLYWLFAFPTRLADRLNFQLRLRGEAPMVSQALMVACSISTALIVVPFFWVFAVVQIQRAINRIVELGPVVPRSEAPAAMTGVRVDVAPAPMMNAEPEAWADEVAWSADVQRRGGHR
ncbi:MAG: hypothetical protein Q8S73_38870 [Deltaproteobacteria bacterium]|nr:hypothetical protein [Myxococcales bacterium]MDP3220129.1 hypothetical protein [Deltaproteobacteria bacterium]